MPTWIDLSAHNAALNVYQSTEGKVLMLRALNPGHTIPDSITELGFEKRGTHFVRDNLRFTLQEIQSHFPLAKPREFSSSEIFFLPAVPPQGNTAPVPASNDTGSPAPWQMNAAAWHAARAMLRAPVNDSRTSEAARLAALEVLDFGVVAWRRGRGPAGDTAATHSTEAVEHLEVIQKAIEAGFRVPFDVVAEYPELLGRDDEAPDMGKPQRSTLASTEAISSARKRSGTERLTRAHETQRFGRHGFVSEYFVTFADGRYPTVIEALHREQAIEFARQERGALEAKAGGMVDGEATAPRERHPDESTVSTTLDSGMRLIEGIARELGMELSEWEVSSDSAIGQWRYSNLAMGAAIVRIAVSEGGVVQVNRDPFTPGDRSMNITYDAVMTSIRAAAPEFHPVDLVKAAETVRIVARARMPAGLKEIEQSAHLFEAQRADGNYKVRFSLVSNALMTKVAADIWNVGESGAEAEVSGTHVPVRGGDVVSATLAAVAATKRYLEDVVPMLSESVAERNAEAEKSRLALDRILALDDAALRRLAQIMGTPTHQGSSWRNFTEIDIHAKPNAEIDAGFAALSVGPAEISTHSPITAAYAAARLPATAPQRIPLFGISVRGEAQRYCLPADFYSETSKNGHAFFAPAERYRTAGFTAAETARYAAQLKGDQEDTARQQRLMDEQMRVMVAEARSTLPEAHLVAAMLRRGDLVRYTRHATEFAQYRDVVGKIVNSLSKTTGMPGFEIQEDRSAWPFSTRVWVEEGQFELLAQPSDQESFQAARVIAIAAYDNPHRIEALIREVAAGRGHQVSGSWADRFTFNVAVPNTLPELIELMEKHFPSHNEQRSAADIDKISSRDLSGDTDYEVLAEKQLEAIRAFRASYARTTQPRVNDMRAIAPDSLVAFSTMEAYALALDEAEACLARYEKKHGAQLEVARQAKWEKFEPYQPGPVKKPLASKIGFAKLWSEEQNGWFQVKNGAGAAWSNGHLFDLGVPHYANYEKYHTSRYKGLSIEERPDIARFIAVEATAKLQPAFVQRDVNKGRDAVLFAREGGHLIGIDKLYYDYIASKHPNAEFFIAKGWNQGTGAGSDVIVHAKVAGAVVAGVMPMRATDDYTVDLVLEMIEMYKPKPLIKEAVNLDDGTDHGEARIVTIDFTSKQRAGGRPAAAAAVRFAKIGDRWFNAITTTHNQGSHASHTGPLTSHGPGFATMFDARFDACNQIVEEQRRLAVYRDSVSTDKQRQAALEMAAWALETALPTHSVTEIAIGPYSGWKQITVTDESHKGLAAVGSSTGDAIESLRARLDLAVSGQLERWRPIGENRSGVPLEEDALGVRALVREGVRSSESVEITPFGPRLRLDKRDIDFLTRVELLALRLDDAQLVVPPQLATERQVEVSPDPASAAATRIGDVVGGLAVDAIVAGVPIAFYRRKIPRHDPRKHIAGKSCTWARAHMDGEWRGLGEPWTQARPSNAELTIAIDHARTSKEGFDSDELLAEINRDIEAGNAECADQSLRSEPVPPVLFKVAKIDADSYELRFKDPAHPFSVLIDYQGPGVYMPSHPVGYSGPRTTLRNAMSWAARDLNASKALYERALQEQHSDAPRLEVDVASFRKLFGTLRDDRATLASVREQNPDPVPNPEVSAFGRPDPLRIPHDLAVGWLDDRTISVSIIEPGHDFTVQIRAVEDDPGMPKRSRWGASGALAKAIGKLEEEVTWAREKAARQDLGERLDALAKRQAEFMRAHDPERHNGLVSSMHRNFALALTDKDYQFLIGWLARPKGQNDLSKKFFTQVTELKLPRTAAEIKTALYGWAGYGAEDAKRMEAELQLRREQAFQAREADRRIRDATAILERTRVRHDGVEKSAREFIDDVVAAGYDALETHKVGAVNRYRLVNRTESRSYPVSGNMVDYARHVLSVRPEQQLDPEEPGPELRLSM